MILNQKNIPYMHVIKIDKNIISLKNIIYGLKSFGVCILVLIYIFLINCYYYYSHIFYNVMLAWLLDSLEKKIACLIQNGIRKKSNNNKE